MPSLPTPRGAAPHTRAARRSSWVMWLGAVICAALLGGWFVASRTDGREARALSAAGDLPDAAAATSVDLPGDPASAPLTRRPASSAVEPDAAGLAPGMSPVSDVPPLVAGRVFAVVGGRGEDAPLGQARLYVEAQWRSADGQREVRITTTLRAVSDAAGRFTIAEPAEGIEAYFPDHPTYADHERIGLRVTARAIGHVDAHADFEPGTIDVRLALASVGSLVVHIVHGGPEDGPSFSLSLTAGDRLFERSKVTHERVSFARLPPGEASLTVWLAGDPEPLTVLHGLVVPPGGGCDDPRLRPLDLSERIAAYAVRVVNERGEPVQRPVFGNVRDLHPRVDVATGGVKNAPGGELSAQADGESSGLLGDGWWRVHARAPVAPEIVVSASDHHPSAPCRLVDGATVTLRSHPRFFIELVREPPPGEVWVQLESTSAEASHGRFNLRAARVVRVPGLMAGNLRARLALRSRDADPRERDLLDVAAGPWVEFEVPEPGEGRVVLDLIL